MKTPVSQARTKSIGAAKMKRMLKIAAVYGGGQRPLETVEAVSVGTELSTQPGSPSKLAKVLQEFLQTESNFLADLLLVEYAFLSPLRKV